MTQKLYHVLGLMSGTSMDGVDAALMVSDGEDFIRVLHTVHVVYLPETRLLLKAAEYAMQQLAGELSRVQERFTALFREYQDLYHCEMQGIRDFAELVAVSTRVHIQAVRACCREAGMLPAQLDFIAYPGQTVYHRANEGRTLQIGDPQRMTAELAVPVISDFRQQDLIHGGQGAPLAPIYHFALVRQQQLLPSVVVNCGGISNMTIIPNDDITQVQAFDVGPGCVLLDRFVRASTESRYHYDENGRFALQGRCLPDITSALYQRSCVRDQENYYQLAAPKSLDSYDLGLLPELSTVDFYDACYTLADFSARLIADSLPKTIKRVILTGGGWQHPVIREALLAHAAQYEITPCHALGWHEQALEAELFAYLGVRSWRGLPITWPNTTGVRKPCSGGVIYRSPSKLASGV